MFFRRLYRPVIPVAIAGGYLAVKITPKIISAKEIKPVEPIKVYGFKGIPDTHALLTYLSWKKIPFEFIHINPIKIPDDLKNTKTIHDLPVVCLDPKNEIYVNGSSETISFFETKENYARENIEVSWEEISDLYPRTKVLFQDRTTTFTRSLGEKDVQNRSQEITTYSTYKVMNKCWPCSPPRTITEETGEIKKSNLLEQTSCQARDSANGELKQVLHDVLHSTYSESFSNTNKALQDVDWFIGSKIFFMLLYSYKTKSNTEEFMAARHKNLRKRETIMIQKEFDRIDLLAIIAAKLAEVKKFKKGRKYFGGSEPNYADVEIYGLLNFMEIYAPDTFNEQLDLWVLKKWYTNMKQKLEEEEDLSVEEVPVVVDSVRFQTG